MPTIAVSPLYIISSARAATGLIHPVPVVGTITSTLRSKAPVRSSSLSSTAIRLSSVSAVCRPAYTRIGSLAGLPLSRVSSSASGPVATKLRPWNPSVSHGAKDVGLPDRSGCRGCTTPARVVVFCGWNTRFAPARKPRNSTPLISVIDQHDDDRGADEQRHLVVQVPAPDEQPRHAS